MSSYPKIYAVIRRIPRGWVATYGQIATLAGLAGQARLVGYALNALPDGTAVPWHRVINAQGRVSTRSAESGGGVLQRILLEREGVYFNIGGHVDLARFGWRPRTAARRRS